MEQGKNVDTLAKWIMVAAVTAVICVVCWYFKSILIYILLSFVVSLIGRPVMRLFGKVKIRGRGIPTWLSAILTLLLLFTVFFGLITRLIPVVAGIVGNISINMQQATFNQGGLSQALESVNDWVISTLPQFGADFRIQDEIVSFFTKSLSVNSVGSVVGSVASTLGSIGIAIFAITFISFFFLREENLFKDIIAALVPDKYEGRAIDALGDIEGLLSRYFVGIIIEILGVTLLDFTGLFLAARLDFSSAIGIAFMCGMFNVIPYLGPWIGAGIGTILGLILKYSEAAATGVPVNFWVILMLLLGTFVLTQLVDNFLFQPLIYSKSIKSSPLEIFIVLLVAGHIGGVLGMLAAIPTYTVIRVIAARFLYDSKPIRRLLESTSTEPAAEENP